MPKYYPINEEAARRAKNANSFSDYVPGSATAAYREMVDRAYALGEQQKGRVDPMYHEKIDGLIDRYARKLAENIIDLIMREEKPLERKVTIRNDRLQKYFPSSYTPKQMEDVIIKLLEGWHRKRQQEQSR